MEEIMEEKKICKHEIGYMFSEAVDKPGYAYWFYALGYDKYCQCGICGTVGVCAEKPGGDHGVRNVTWINDQKESVRIKNEAVAWNRKVTNKEVSARFLHNLDAPRKDKRPVLQVLKP
jgi:hypothetical protein